MKKLSIVIAGLMFSGMASAVPFATSGTLNQVQCPNLNEDVRINLTTGVEAGVHCRAAAGAVPARVAIAACHASGMQKSRTITSRTVAAVPPATEPTVITGCVVGVDGCTQSTAIGPAMPGSTTLVGTVNIGYPGGGACTAAAADTAAAAL